MDDPKIQRLEAELSSMRPRAVPPELSARIEDAMSRNEVVERRTSSDRLLIGAMGAGALAACVIVGMFIVSGVSPASAASGPPRQTVTQSTPDAPRFGDYPLAMARVPEGDLAK